MKKVQNVGTKSAFTPKIIWVLLKKKIKKLKKLYKTSPKVYKTDKILT